MLRGYTPDGQGTGGYSVSGGVALSTLVTGLVAYWSLDETSGTRADSVGSADLTDNNTVGSTSGGPNGTCADFVKANTEYFTGSEIAVGQSDEGMTFAGWFKLDVSGAYPSLISAITPVSFGMYINGTDAYGRFTDSAAAEQTTAAVAFTLEAWHFAIGWFDPADKKGRLSIDGSEAVATAALGTTSLASYTSLGVAYWTFVDWWDGQIGPIGLWNRALTSDERAELYNSGTGKFFNGTNFV